MGEKNKFDQDWKRWEKTISSVRTGRDGKKQVWSGLEEMGKNNKFGPDWKRWEKRISSVRKGWEKTRIN